MIKIPVAKLKNNLFEYLDKVSAGETIILQKDGLDIAQVHPTKQVDWRDKMNIKPKLLVSDKEFMEPINNLRED